MFEYTRMYLYSHSSQQYILFAINPNSRSFAGSRHPKGGVTGVESNAGMKAISFGKPSSCSSTISAGSFTRSVKLCFFMLKIGLVWGLFVVVCVCFIYLYVLFVFLFVIVFCTPEFIFKMIRFFIIAFIVAPTISR